MVDRRYFAITREKKNRSGNMVKTTIDLDADEIFDLVHAVSEIQRELTKTGGKT